MKSRIECPSCRSEGRPLASYEQAHLRKCINCGLAYSDSIPEDRDLEAHYDNYGRDDYLSPITIKRYSELLNRFESSREINSLLDVGCGMGFFGEQAVKSRWNVYGTEFSEKAVKMAEDKGLIVKKGELEKMQFETKFDVITAFEVIEHLSDPSGFIEKCSELLRPGGLLYLTTPNFNSLNSRLLKSKWNVVTFPEHLNYFTSVSMSKMAIDRGFKVKNTRTTGISPGRLIRSLRGQEMDFSDSGQTDEVIRSKMESNGLMKFTKSVANGFLMATGLGENLKVELIRL